VKSGIGIVAGFTAFGPPRDVAVGAQAIDARSECHEGLNLAERRAFQFSHSRCNIRLASERAQNTEGGLGGFWAYLFVF
jgi:hypothetical protein